MIWLGFFTLAIMIVIFAVSVEKTKYGEFSEPVWWLASFGIYQWGQALFLAPFWAIIGLFIVFYLPLLQLVKIYLIFHFIRALTELMLMVSPNYQGLHQLLFPHTKAVTPPERRILYQLFQGIIMTTAIITLWQFPF